MVKKRYADTAMDSPAHGKHDGMSFNSVYHYNIICKLH